MVEEQVYLAKLLTKLQNKTLFNLLLQANSLFLQQNNSLKISHVK